MEITMKVKSFEFQAKNEKEAYIKELLETIKKYTDTDNEKTEYNYVIKNFIGDE